jgi:hypothetical protein
MYIEHPHYWPSPGLMNRLSANLAITNVAHVQAAIFQVPKDGDITDVKFATRAVTTGCTIDARIETLDASGDPSNTLVNAGANVNIVVADTDDFVFKEGTLGTAATVTAGQYIAVALRVAAGTPNLQLGYSAPILGTGLPYRSDNTSGAFVKATTPPIILIKYSGDSGYTTVPGMPPARTVTANTYNSGSTPDERGNLFVPPVSMRVVGLVTYYATTNDCEFVLYDSSDTVLGTATVDGTNKVNNNILTFLFDQDYIDLTKGESYRIVCKPGGSNVNLYVMDGVDFDAFGGLTSSDICYTARTNGGSWSETTTSVTAITLIATGITTSSGSNYSFS